MECQRLDWVKHKTNCLVAKRKDFDEARICLASRREESENEGHKVEIGQGIGSKLSIEDHPKTAVQITKSHDCSNDGMEDIGSGELCINVDVQPCSTPIDKQVEQLSEGHSHISIYIHVKYAKEKHKIQIGIPCSGLEAFSAISQVIRVPVGKLKLIHKGKLQTVENIAENLEDNVLFFAMGEMAENEDGLDAMDIEIIMKQLSVYRNVAIKALRKTGCLLDAIFEVGNSVSV